MYSAALWSFRNRFTRRLVFEAGGLLTDLEGGEEWLEKGSVCCGNPKIFGQLLPLVGKLPAPEAKPAEAKEDPAAEGDAK